MNNIMLDKMLDEIERDLQNAITWNEIRSIDTRKLTTRQRNSLINWIDDYFHMFRKELERKEQKNEPSQMVT